MDAGTNVFFLGALGSDVFLTGVLDAHQNAGKTLSLSMLEEIGRMLLVARASGMLSQQASSVVLLDQYDEGGSAISPGQLHVQPPYEPDTIDTICG